MEMSRHQLEKGKQIQECRDIINNSSYVRHPMSRHHNNMAATPVEEVKDYIVQMSQHQNDVATFSKA